MIKLTKALIALSALAGTAYAQTMYWCAAAGTWVTDPAHCLACGLNL